MPITVTDVRDLIPLDTGTIPDALLQQYIDIVTEEADLQLQNIFADPLPSILEADCQNYGTQNTFGSNIIAIAAWQETGLVVKRTSIENKHKTTLTEDPLVLGWDYTLWFGWKGNKIPGKNLPVTNIQLLNRGLSKNEILRVSGTYGWKAGYPSDVLLALTNVIAALVGYANSLGANAGESGYTRIKSMTTEVEVGDIMAEQLRNQARDFLNDPAFVAIIEKYRVVLESGIAII